MGKVKNTNVLLKVQNVFKPRSSTSSSETALPTPSVSAEKQSTIELYLESQVLRKLK